MTDSANATGEDLGYGYIVSFPNTQNSDDMRKGVQCSYAQEDWRQNISISTTDYKMDLQDVMEVVGATGGCFANDPLMAYAVACSSEVKPEVREMLLPELDKQKQRGQTNISRMLQQSGVRRLGSAEEQEAVVDRMLKKRGPVEEIEDENTDGHN
jgi:hypothetical protein